MFPHGFRAEVARGSDRLLQAIGMPPTEESCCLLRLGFHALPRAHERPARRASRREDDAGHAGVNHLYSAAHPIGFVPDAAIAEVVPPSRVPRYPGEGLQALEIPPVLPEARVHEAEPQVLMRQQPVRRVLLDRTQAAADAQQAARTLQRCGATTEIDDDEIRVAGKIDGVARISYGHVSWPERFRRWPRSRCSAGIGRRAGPGTAPHRAG